MEIKNILFKILVFVWIPFEFSHALYKTEIITKNQTKYSELFKSVVLYSVTSKSARSPSLTCVGVLISPTKLYTSSHCFTDGYKLNSDKILASTESELNSNLWKNTTDKYITILKSQAGLANVTSDKIEINTEMRIERVIDDGPAYILHINDNAIINLPVQASSYVQISANYPIIKKDKLIGLSYRIPDSYDPDKFGVQDVINNLKALTPTSVEIDLKWDYKKTIGRGQTIIGRYNPGDSGSPVFVKYGDDYKLVGLVSHGPKSGLCFFSDILNLETFTWLKRILLITAK